MPSRSLPILGLLATAFLGAHLLFALLPDLFEPWNLRAVDRLFRIRHALDAGAPSYDPRVAYVELRDEDLAAMRKPYFDRGDYARLVRALTACRVGVQVHDATFLAATGEAGEADLLDAVRSAPGTVLGFIAALDRGAPAGAGLPWPARLEGEGSGLPVVAAVLPRFRALEDAAAGLGFIDVMEDPDGVLRRAPLVARGVDGLRPALPLAAVCRYFGVEAKDIVVRPGESITLKAPKGVRDLVVPIDERGRVILDYIGPWEAMDHFSVADVLRAAEDEEDLEILRERLKGRVVLVADLSTGAGDVGTMALDARYPQPGQHATAIHSLLTRRFLREVPFSKMLLVELLLMAGMFVVAARRRTVAFFGGALALLVLFILAGALMFFYAGWIFHLMRPLIMLLAAILLLWGHRYLLVQAQRQRLRTAFEAYFPPRLVERYVRTPDALQLGGRRAELTVLFSDIVGFSTLTEDMEPIEVHGLLSEYFGEMVEVAFDNGGTVDKFIGDGLMVFFGDPVQQADHALRAARAALAMQRRVRTLNERFAAKGRPPIQIRVGINSGPVIVGNMGSDRRLSYTVLGAPVNLAQRMESNAPPGGVLISGGTHELLGGALDSKAVDPVKAKGFSEPVPAFLLIDSARG